MTLAQQLHKDLPRGVCQLVATSNCNMVDLSYLSSVLDRTALDLQLWKKINLLLLEDLFGSQESWQCGWREKQMVRRRNKKSNKPSELREFVKGKVCQRVFEYYNVVFPCLELSQKTHIYQDFSDWTNTWTKVQASFSVINTLSRSIFPR